MKCVELEGKILQVAEALGLAIKSFDLVVGAFERF
jgi:hypothetical protein